MNRFISKHVHHDKGHHPKLGPFGFFPGPERVRVLLLASTIIGDNRIKQIMARNKIAAIRDLYSTIHSGHRT
jgi:hypothetical protein